MPERERLTERQREVLDFIQDKIQRDGYPPTIREIGDQLGIRSTNGVNDHLKALAKKGYLLRTEAKSRACVPTDAPADDRRLIKRGGTDDRTKTSELGARTALTRLSGGGLQTPRAPTRLSAVEDLPTTTPLVGGSRVEPPGLSRSLSAVNPLSANAASKTAGATKGNVELVDFAQNDDDEVDIPLLGRIAAGQPILALESQEDSVRIDRMFLGRQRERDVFALRVVGESMIEDGINDGDFIFVRKQAQATRGAIVVALIDDEATVKRYYPEGDRIRFQPSNSAMQPIYVLASEFKNTQILGIVVGIYRRMD